MSNYESHNTVYAPSLIIKPFWLYELVTLLLFISHANDFLARSPRFWLKVARFNGKSLHQIDGIQNASAMELLYLWEIRNFSIFTCVKFYEKQPNYRSLKLQHENQRSLIITKVSTLHLQIYFFVHTRVYSYEKNYRSVCQVTKKATFWLFMSK